MTDVREATLELLRSRGMTTIFGNPGSTELPMLRDFPDDFSYVLGLQELAVVGMADGYAQASGRPAHVNLHTAPGLGNAIGGIGNAQANRAPLLITAGQQVRAQITMEANLTNRDATLVPLPYVKWAHEPARAQDVPAAIARAIHHATLPPKGPAFVSVPMDDWDAEVDEHIFRSALARAVRGRALPDPVALEDLAGALEQARNPVLVAGPDIDASGGWDAAVSLSDKQRLAVWATPAPGGGRLGFPEDHAYFQGVLPPAIGPLSETLAGHDLVLVVGSSVFPYYPYIPGDLLPAGARLVQLTSDPAEASRAPTGTAIVGDVALALEHLLELVGPSERDAPQPRASAGEPPPSEPISGSEAMAALAEVWPQDAIAVVESPSSTVALRNRLRLSRPGSYYFSASGGLGFGIAAAVGVQLAQRERPVVCVLGEGSAQYGITALWTAAAYRVPVTYLVLRNEEYAILKWFEQLEQISGSPGLDLKGVDVGAVAEAYGVPSLQANSREDLAEALRAAIAVQDGPRLVEVAVAPGMWLE
ncbi:MAG TPA: benzoylformate decarboxylase [Solirubrobacteraceae bacterium]|jgi:benzoylformate decarboxylase|nr:benzoylformate decarboxylase [Solirubrobacteraceae bacterium]